MKPKPKKRKAAKMERITCTVCEGWGFSSTGLYCQVCNGWGYLWRKAVKR